MYTTTFQRQHNAHTQQTKQATTKTKELKKATTRLFTGCANGHRIWFGRHTHYATRSTDLPETCSETAGSVPRRPLHHLGAPEDVA